MAGLLASRYRQSMADEPNYDASDPSQLPGCGIGIYAALLLSIGLLGLGGIGLSTWALFQGGEVTSSELMPGHELQVYQLSALRRAELIEVEEVPEIFHDESPTRDGATACALMSDRLVRVVSVSNGRGWSCQNQTEGPILGWTIAYDQIEAVDSEGTHYSDASVMIYGTDAEGEAVEIQCEFGPEEGAMRFKRVVQSLADLPVDP